MGQVIFKLDDDLECWRDGCDLGIAALAPPSPLSKPESEGRSPHLEHETAGYGTVSVQLLPRDNAKTQCGFLGYREMARHIVHRGRSAVSTRRRSRQRSEHSTPGSNEAAGGDSAKPSDRRSSSRLPAKHGAYLAH